MSKIVDWPKYRPMLERMLAAGKTGGEIAEAIPGATRSGVEGYIKRNNLRAKEDAPKIDLVSAKEPRRSLRSKQGLNHPWKETARPTQEPSSLIDERQIVISVDAATYAFLADCATVSGGEPEDIAASMLAEIVRDTEASEAA